MPGALHRTVIDTGAVAVYHGCGAQVLITHVGFSQEGVRLEAICPKCGHYVYLLWAAGDPIAGDKRGNAPQRAAWPEVAPRPDMSLDALIDELENRLTVAYLRASLERR